VIPQSFEFIAGEDLYIPIPILDDDGVAVDLVGVTARFVASRAVGVAPVIDSGASSATATVTVGTPDDNDVLVEVPDDVTDSLDGTYRWELKLFGLLGGERVACWGYMTATQSLTSDVDS